MADRSRNAFKRVHPEAEARATLNAGPVTEARLSQLFDPIVRLADDRGPYAGATARSFSGEYANLTAYPAIVEPSCSSDEGNNRSSMMSSCSMGAQSTGVGVGSGSGGYLNLTSGGSRGPSSVDGRASLASQTSSLHTALSELAGDVEVVDMEDGPHGRRHSLDDGEFVGGGGQQQRPAHHRGHRLHQSQRSGVHHQQRRHYDGSYGDLDADGLATTSTTTMAASPSSAAHAGEVFWAAAAAASRRSPPPLPLDGDETPPRLPSGVDADDCGLDDDDFDDNYDEETYCPYVYSMEGDCAVNWQERCVELETSLQRFRDQAGKIRGLLRDKLAEMEARVVDAETRAEIAEEKIRVMEQHLAESQWSPSEASQQLTTLHHTVVAKERDITRLEDQVDEQRKMRLNDAKQVEAKAAKIKEWVTNKLRELEDQNQHLREQNQKCNEQLELLRNRLHQLSQANTNGKNRRASTEDSSRGSLEEQPGSDDSLGRALSASTPAPGSASAPTAANGGGGGGSGDAAAQLDALYAEVDLAKKRQQRSTASSTAGGGGGGLGLSGPISNMMQQRFPDANRLSLSGLTRSVRDSRVDSGSVDLETPLSLSPKSPLAGLELNDADLSSSSGGGGGLKKPIPPPRTRLPRKDSDHSVNGRSPAGSFSEPTSTASTKSLDQLTKVQCPSAAGTLSGLSDVDAEAYDNHGGATSALGELGQAIDQAIASMTLAAEHADYDVPKPPRSLKVRTKLVTNEVHDYAEIYTPSKERLPWAAHATLSASTASTASGSASVGRHSRTPGSGSDAGGCGGGGDFGVGVDYHDDSKPPTPPLHRFPSWESRIYQAAADGFSVTAEPPPPPAAGVAAPETAAARSTPRLSTAGYQDISVPVYATVKGRASQIRSVPFSGDSSDSSDGEDHAADAAPPASRGHDAAAAGNDSGASDADYALPPDASAPCDAVSPLPKETSAALEVVAVHAASPLVRVSTLERGRMAAGVGVDAGEPLEKSGYLTKLSGKLKTWRKRWFVLHNGTLSYWKSQSDAGRKAQGQISLDDTCRVVRADGAATFEIGTAKKTHYLTADSSAAVDEWVRVLQAVVRRNTTRLLLGRDDHKPTLQGWIMKVKHGHSKRSWCVLVGKLFLYFKSPSDQVPQGQINMRDARVEEVDHVSDSDSEEADGPTPSFGTGSAHLTVGIFPANQDPTYLLFSNKQEKDSWLYQLTIVSGLGAQDGTQYEQIIQKLMEIDGDPACNLWRVPLLLHSKDTIASPLTTLPNESLHAEAIKLFKAIQLFTSVLLDSAGIDYHVVLAQNALQQCLSITPELQPELLCALVKQTSRLHPTPTPASSSSSSSSSSATSSSAAGGGGASVSASVGAAGKRVGGSQKTSGSSLPPTGLGHAAPASNDASPGASPAAGAGGGSAVGSGGGAGQAASVADTSADSKSFVLVQGWQLLALAVSLFAPKNNKLLWYLRLHLRRNADTKTEIGKYASYCQRALERALQMGPRDAKPSRMEVLSILLKNPYHHSLPHAIPVHFLNGTYQVVGFDGSTTVEEFLVTLNQEVGCRDVGQSGFALFSDDPIEKDGEHWLEPRSKLCDVISKWETALREKGLGKFQNTKVIRMTYRHRLYWRNSLKGETERERLLHCYQTALRIADNRFPLTRELAIELAAIMSQIDAGDYNPDRAPRGSGGSGGGGGGHHGHHQGAMQALERFIPRRYKDGISQEDLKQMVEAISDKWTALKGRSIGDCVRIYLTCTRKWPLFGAALFHAKVKSGGGNSDLEGVSVWLAVNEEAITLLDMTTMQSVARVPYSAVVTFGGCQDDLMVVVNNCDIQGPGTQRMLFSLAKPKILELTLLIADYMNALGCVLPNTPNATLARSVDSRRSARSKTKEREVPSYGGHHGHHGHLGHHHGLHVGPGYAHHGQHQHGHYASGHHRLQAGAEPDILRATPEMESKMLHNHHGHGAVDDAVVKRRAPSTDS